MRKNITWLRIKQLLADIQSLIIRREAQQKDDIKSWTRKRRMPLVDMLLCILAKKGLTTVMELRNYFKEADKMDEKVSKQGYLKQRKKLNPKVFKVLNSKYLKRFYQSGEAQTWLGYVVSAIDGSRAEIPDSKENRKTYGTTENQAGIGVARANVSALHDVYNGFIIDLGIDSYKSSERELARDQIDKLKEIVGSNRVLIMFDRNYISIEFMNYLEKAGVKYLMRLKKTDYVAELSAMESLDEEVTLFYTKERLKNIKKNMPERYSAIYAEKSTRVRVIKVRFDNGEEAAFMTNLKEGTAKDIKDLYRERWSIEKKYHTLKNKMKFESVTGKASIYVEQDFWAQVLVFNIVQDLIHAAEYRAKKAGEEKKLKHEVRINENIAIGLFKETMIALMLEEDEEQRGRIYTELIAEMEKEILPIRNCASQPRRFKHSNKYKCNQKPAF